MKSIILYYFTVICVGCAFLAGCSGSDKNTKAIWSYEQRQTSDPDFQFYPLETKSVGQITVKDSMAFIEKAMVQPVDSLLQQNSRAMKSLLQMQTLYVKYDMETLRETLSPEIGQLESSQRWLHFIKKRVDEYRSMPLDKVLIRKVECRYEYNIPLTVKKEIKDKIYFIHATTGNVVMVEERSISKTTSRL
jgi:hypothetical protein